MLEVSRSTNSNCRRTAVESRSICILPGVKNVLSSKPVAACSGGTVVERLGFQRPDMSHLSSGLTVKACNGVVVVQTIGSPDESWLRRLGYGDKAKTS